MYTWKVYFEVFGLSIPNTSDTNGQYIQNNKMCLWLNFFPDFFFYHVGFKLIHLSLESDSVYYQCNKYCVTRKHCGGGDCGWLWGSGHCHFYGCRKKTGRQGLEFWLGVYVYDSRIQKKFPGVGVGGLYRINHPPSLLVPSMYIMSVAVNFTFFKTILHVFKQ